MLSCWVFRLVISDWAAVTAAVSCEPTFEAWTASVRMRCRMFCAVPRAPSAICATLMPSWALDTAWVRPLIWLVRPWLIDRPAASSAALLIRRPEDSRSKALSRLPWFGGGGGGAGGAAAGGGGRGRGGGRPGRGRGARGW